MTNFNLKRQLLREVLPVALACIAIAITVGMASTAGAVYAVAIGLLAFIAYVALRTSASLAVAGFFGGLTILVVVAGIFFANYAGVRYFWWYAFVGLFIALVPAFIEHVLLRLAQNHPLGAVMRVTYYEALLQPFTLIVIGLAFAAIYIAGFVPFYTLSEDHKMYRDVASQFVQLAGLIVMVYAAAKVIDEEIENRTMLTLMSKPIARWQVVVGKYLGVAAVLFVVVSVLAIATGLLSHLRFYEDMRIDFNVVSNRAEFDALILKNLKATLSFIPLFALQFLMLATLAAISVAISTRWSLALNMVVIAVLYIGANMTRYIDSAGLPDPWQALAVYSSYVLPYLGNFDLSHRLIYADPPFQFAGESPLPNSRTLGAIWTYVGLVTVYSGFYITAALGLATVMFRTRELS